MIALHPEILSKNGKKLFAVIPYEEFQAIQEKLEDEADWEALQLAKAEEGNAPSVSLEEARRILKEKRKRAGKS